MLFLFCFANSLMSFQISHSPSSPQNNMIFTIIAKWKLHLQTRARRKPLHIITSAYEPINYSDGCPILGALLS